MLCGCPSERCIIVGCLRRDLRQDYGNAEANDKDTGPGSMESVFWGEGCGSPDDWGPKDGPQVRGDLEDGCWGGEYSCLRRPFSLCCVFIPLVLLREPHCRCQLGHEPANQRLVRDGNAEGRQRQPLDAQG